MLLHSLREDLAQRQPHLHSRGADGVNGRLPFYSVHKAVFRPSDHAAGSQCQNSSTERGLSTGFGTY
jgi:hypothetical protein